MFSVKRKINFFDCDPAGILFYGRVFELCHSAYEELIESFHLDEDYWNNKKYTVPIISSEALYHKPVKYGETIIIEIRVSQLRSSSFELQYECKKEDGKKCFKVKTVHVFVDRKTWKKKNIEANVKQRLTKHFE